MTTITIIVIPLLLLYGYYNHTSVRIHEWASNARVPLSEYALSVGEREMERYVLEGKKGKESQLEGALCTFYSSEGREGVRGCC